MEKFICQKLIDMKAQAWTVDFIIAMLIFSIAITLLITFSISGRTDYGMIDNINEFSSHIMSDGYPTNWNKTNVVYPGILSNGILNETKMINMKDLNESFVSSSYRLSSKFYVNVTNLNGSILDIGGPVEIGSNPSHASEIIKEKRFSSFNGAPVIVNLIVWK